MPRFLMCPPHYYGIRYEINPWMHRSVQSILSLARQQWSALYRLLREELQARVELLEAMRGLPDLVFTANAGLLRGRKVFLSRFRYRERQPEEKYYARFFRSHGYRVARLPEGIFFEGAGDALWLTPPGGREELFAGYRFRSDIASHNFIARELGQEVISLELTQACFYHLDTCFCPLPRGELIWYPPAFDRYARKVIRDRIPRRIELCRREAFLFGANAVAVGDSVVLPAGCYGLSRELTARGYRAYEVELSEFKKAGGAAKCLTLALGTVC